MATDGWLYFLEDCQEWIKADPEWALGVLLETGAIEQYGDCGRCAGREVCQFIDYSKPPDHQPVYRVVPKTEETTT